MVKHIKPAALLLCISLFSLHRVPAHAQEGFNNKKALYGLHLGFTENWVDIYYSDIEGYSTDGEVEMEMSPGSQARPISDTPGITRRLKKRPRRMSYITLIRVPGAQNEWLP